MKTLLLAIFLGGPLLVGNSVQAVEEAKYDVLSTDGTVELRRYAPKIVAQTIVSGDFSDVGNEGFRRLASYIFGANKTTEKIAMTAPVNQAATVQNAAAQDWRITFMMPASSTAETLPEPNDKRVVLRQQPATVMAAIRYSGTWGRDRYQEHENKLRTWIKTNGFKISGVPVFARYNPPFTLWFLRRNEVLIPIQYPDKGVAG